MTAVDRHNVMTAVGRHNVMTAVGRHNVMTAVDRHNVMTAVDMKLCMTLCGETAISTVNTALQPQCRSHIYVCINNAFLLYMRDIKSLIGLLVAGGARHSMTYGVFAMRALPVTPR
jgi:hypothetical protein